MCFLDLVCAVSGRLINAFIARSLCRLWEEETSIVRASVFSSVFPLSCCVYEQGDSQKAETLYRKALTMLRAGMAHDPLYIGTVLVALADLLARKIRSCPFPVSYMFTLDLLYFLVVFYFFILIFGRFLALSLSQP